MYFFFLIFDALFVWAIYAIFGFEIVVLVSIIELMAVLDCVRYKQEHPGG